jgi:hypothetical protein
MDGVLRYFYISLFRDFYLDHLISGVQIFEEPTLQFIECKQLDVNNQLTASPQEQLISSAKFNNKSIKTSF